MSETSGASSVCDAERGTKSHANAGGAHGAGHDVRHEIGHCNGWPADHVGARPDVVRTAKYIEYIEPPPVEEAEDLPPPPRRPQPRYHEPYPPPAVYGPVPPGWMVAPTPFGPRLIPCILAPIGVCI